MVDHDDPRVLAATRTEQRLVERYGLDYETHFITLNEHDIRIRVLELGSGPPILMVPGGPGQASQFVPLMAELTGWRLIAVDRPGGGMSDGVDHRQVNVRSLAIDTLSAVLDYFELETVPVVANSMGGLWTFWFALDRPERLSMMAQIGCPALILDSSAPLPMRLLSVPYLNRLIFSAVKTDNPDKARKMFQMLGASPEATQTIPNVFLETVCQMGSLPGHRTSWLSLMEAFLTPRGAKGGYQLGSDELRRVTQPVHFIWGNSDPFGDVEIGRRAATIVPDATFNVIDGGHVPFIDNPEACARVIREFIPQTSRLSAAAPVDTQPGAYVG